MPSRSSSAAPAAPWSGACSAAAPPTGRPRVLVVDDEASIRDLLSKTLALAEYDVDLAPDGRSALDRLRITPYDLLITDVIMPGLDGLSLAIKVAERCPKLRVLVMTGFAEQEQRAQVEGEGVQAVSSKPFPLQQIWSAADDALAVA